MHGCMRVQALLLLVHDPTLLLGSIECQPAVGPATEATEPIQRCAMISCCFDCRHMRNQKLSYYAELMFMGGSCCP